VRSVSQKNLSHSSLIRSVAPPRRLWFRSLVPSLRVDDFFALGVSASWFVDVMAARGGLEGGDGSPVEGTSGIPLGPCGAGSAVVEALERGVRGIDEVAAGEDIGLAGNVLAVVITTAVIIIVLFHWRHFCWRVPALPVTWGDWRGESLG
jgi:hypothetical protein